MRDIEGTEIKVGDVLERLTDYGFDNAPKRMYTGTRHVVEAVWRDYVKVTSDPGKWELSKDWRIVPLSVPARKGEFYVAEIRMNNQGGETFCRAGDLHKEKYETAHEAEIAAKRRAEANPHQKFVVMDITARIYAEPVYITKVVRY